MLFVIMTWLKPGEDEWLEGVWVDDREAALRRLEELRYQNKWDLDRVKLKKDYKFRIDVYGEFRLLDDFWDEEDRDRNVFDWRDRYYSVPLEPEEVIE